MRGRRRARTDRGALRWTPGRPEGPGRLERILEPRELEDVEKPVHRSAKPENDARGSRLTALGGGPRVLVTPDLDPSAPIPYVLTDKARELLELEAVSERPGPEPDELGQEEELEELDSFDDDDDDEPNYLEDDDELDDDGWDEWDPEEEEF